MNKNDNLSTIIQKIQSKMTKSTIVIDGGYIQKDKRIEQKISFFKNKELLTKYNNRTIISGLIRYSNQMSITKSL